MAAHEPLEPAVWRSKRGTPATSSLFIKKKHTRKKCSTRPGKLLRPDVRSQPHLHSSGASQREYRILEAVQSGLPFCICKDAFTDFFDDFKVQKEIGIGAYGRVLVCERIRDSAIFAVKVIDKRRQLSKIKSYESRLRHLRSLRNEVTVLRLVSVHPNIATLHLVYEDDDDLYLVLEYCTGGELFDRLVAEGKLDEPRAACVLKQLCSVIKYLHERCGIVHCDIKPANILLESADSLQIKLVDFGMANALRPGEFLTHTSGSPFYTAPEVIQTGKRKPHYRHPCDMWSLGVVLFVMIFNFPPFAVDKADFKGKPREMRKAIYRKVLTGFYPKVYPAAKYGYGPWFPDTIASSAEVRELISGLLRRDASKRLTAAQVLRHPWIRTQAADCRIESPPSLTPIPSLSPVPSQSPLSMSRAMDARKVTATTRSTTALLKAPGSDSSRKKKKKKKSSISKASASTMDLKSGIDVMLKPISVAEFGFVSSLSPVLEMGDERVVADLKQLLLALAKMTRGCLFREAVARLYEGEFKVRRTSLYATMQRCFNLMDSRKRGVVDMVAFSRFLTNLDTLNIEPKHVVAMYRELALPGIGEESFSSLGLAVSIAIDSSSAEGSAEGIRFSDFLTAAVIDYIGADGKRLRRIFNELAVGSEFVAVQNIVDRLQEMDARSAANWKRVAQIINEERIEAKRDTGVDFAEFCFFLDPRFQETPEWCDTLFS